MRQAPFARRRKRSTTSAPPEVPVWCGGMLESGIGHAALASLPNFTIPGDISPSRRYWEEDIVTPEWTISADRFVEVPFDRPGLGIEIERVRIAKLTVRRENWIRAASLQSCQCFAEVCRTLLRDFVELRDTWTLYVRLSRTMNRSPHPDHYCPCMTDFKKSAERGLQTL